MISTTAVSTKLPGRTVPVSLYTGAVLAVFVMIASLSFGSLIFGGELSFGVADGIGTALISATVVGLVMAWRSSYPVTIAIPQDRTAPILALMAAQVVAALPAGTSPAEKLINVLAAIALTSLVTGALLYLLGHYRLGNLTRFIPYPVVGGFLSGSGWLLVLGSFRVMTGRQVTPANLPDLFLPGVLKLWLPGVGVGVAIFLALRIYRRTKLVPVILLAAMAIFYGVMILSGVGAAEARAAGWLPVIPAGENFRPHLWELASWQAVHFQAIGHAAGLVATAMVTAALSILLNSSALELAVHQEIDLNQELRAAGLANLAGGLAGGMLGFQSLSLSRLANDLGARTRLAATVTALFCGLALFAGPTVFAYLPKFALGALLLYLGLGFLAEYLYDGWSKLPLSDYAVVVLIVAVMGTVGYLEGVGVGVLAAVFLFIHNYSRVGVITHALTGAELQSNVDRPVAHQRLLQKEGGRLHLLKLQGFIFFGTANSLLNNIRERVADEKRPGLSCVILDFRRVSGLDSSAALSLAKAGQLARKSGFQLLLTQVPDDMQHHLERGFARDERAERPKFFPDLDHALEWWETRKLAEHGLSAQPERSSLREQMAAFWPNGHTLDSFVARLDRRVLNEGQYLIRQGDAASEVYFVESGEVSTLLESGNGSSPRRLRRGGGGTVLGELGLLLRQPRSASVMVNHSATVYCLSAAALEQLKRDQPYVAADFYEYLSRYLSERVINTTKSLRVLAD